jgi:hypothetical protein
MAPKPICIIKVDMDRIRPSTDLWELTNVFSDRMPDYHVFVIPNDDHEEPHDVLEFQVFYEKDQLPIDYEGLKNLIKPSN